MSLRYLQSFQAPDSFDRSAFRTSASRTLYTQTGKMPPATARIATSYGQCGNRPLTSNRAAGYTSKGRNGMAAFAATRDIPSSSLSKLANADGLGTEQTPNGLIKQAEKKITGLVEESVVAAADGNLPLALD